MQIIAILMLCVVLYALLAGVMPAAAEVPENLELVEFYSDCIDTVISKCEQEAYLMNSQSKYVRDYAIRISHKAAYCRDNKRRLIYEMIAGGIGSNPNKVENYVNQSFLAALRTENSIE